MSTTFKSNYNRLVQQAFRMQCQYTKKKKKLYNYINNEHDENKIERIIQFMSIKIISTKN